MRVMARSLNMISGLISKKVFFTKNRAILGLFFIYFCLFKPAFQFLQQIIVTKSPTNIWCWDSNSRHSEHKSPPITTRSGLRHFSNKFEQKEMVLIQTLLQACLKSCIKVSLKLIAQNVMAKKFCVFCFRGKTKSSKI